MDIAGRKQARRREANGFLAADGTTLLKSSGIALPAHAA
jgi:hypothetical protein